MIISKWNIPSLCQQLRQRRFSLRLVLRGPISDSFGRVHGSTRHIGDGRCCYYPSLITDSYQYSTMPHYRPAIRGWIFSKHRLGAIKIERFIFITQWVCWIWYQNVPFSISLTLLSLSRNVLSKMTQTRNVPSKMSLQKCPFKYVPSNMSLPTCPFQYVPLGISLQNFPLLSPVSVLIRHTCQNRSGPSIA